jgi:hypothetical protein
MVGSVVDPSPFTDWQQASRQRRAPFGTMRLGRGIPFGARCRIPGGAPAVRRGERPVHREERPVNREERPVNREEPPVYRKERPVHRDERPVHRDARPVPLPHGHSPVKIWVL